MTRPKAIKWEQAPNISTPYSPALFSDMDSLWLAYGIDCDDHYAVLRFGSVIDHHIAPITDESIGKHPYVGSGLDWYSFHEIVDSPEATPWTVPRASMYAKHWVITFKDNSLDVVARSVEVLHQSMIAEDATSALFSVLCSSKG